MEKQTNIYCFTFGQSHVHPRGGHLMRDYWVEVHGDYGEARQKMIEKYGDKWAFQYPKSDFDDCYYRNGCYEVLNNSSDLEPDLCSCGRPLVPCYDSKGKKIGVTHTPEDADWHREFWSAEATEERIKSN